MDSMSLRTLSGIVQITFRAREVSPPVVFTSTVVALLPFSSPASETDWIGVENA